MTKRIAEQIIKSAQVREDREHAARLARIKRAVAQSDFYTHELTALEQIVFGAFGRTKLR